MCDVLEKELVSESSVGLGCMLTKGEEESVCMKGNILGSISSEVTIFCLGDSVDLFSDELQMDCWVVEDVYKLSDALGNVLERSTRFSFGGGVLSSG